jgi:hypothetical protein
MPENIHIMRNFNYKGTLWQRSLIALTFVSLFAGCSSVHSGARGKVAIHEREIMVDRSGRSAVEQRAGGFNYGGKRLHRRTADQLIYYDATPA